MFSLTREQMMCFMIKHNYVGNLDFYWYVCVCTLGNQIQYATFKFHNNNVSGIKVLKSSAFPNGARSTPHSHACQDGGCLYTHIVFKHTLYSCILHSHPRCIIKRPRVFQF